MKDVLICDKRR